MNKEERKEMNGLELIFSIAVNGPIHIIKLRYPRETTEADNLTEHGLLKKGGEGNNFYDLTEKGDKLYKQIYNFYKMKITGNL